MTEGTISSALSHGDPGTDSLGQIFAMLGYTAFEYSVAEELLHLSSGCERLGLPGLHAGSIALTDFERHVHPDDLPTLRTLLDTADGATVLRRVIRFLDADDSAAIETVICAGGANHGRVVGALRPARGGSGAHALRLNPGDDSVFRVSEFELLQRRIDARLTAHIPFSLTLFAVDNLARIYRTFGHACMKTLMPALRERLQHSLPDAAVAPDGIGRFFVVTDDLDTACIEAAVAAFEAESFEGPEGPMVLTLSAGITQIFHADDALHAISRAEETLSIAKSGGRQSHAVYRPKPADPERKGDAAITQEVIRAIKEGRLIPAFQPIVESRTERTIGWEVLARLRTESGELWNGAQFIIAAERNGLIGAVDRCIAERALEKLQERKDIYLSINVSAETARDRRRLDGLIDLIAAHRNVSERLTVEITETASPGDIEESAAFVKRLHGLGCTVAVDDFGVGYTSFAALKNLNVNAVKIDGLYIRNLAKSPENRLFVRSIVELASGLKMKTVAEMVGNQEEVELLRAVGVDALQGFYFGHPQMELPMPGGAKVFKGKAAS